MVRSAGRTSRFNDRTRKKNRRRIRSNARRLSTKWQQLALDGAPWIFLYKQFNYLGVNKNLTGWSPRPDEVIDLRGAQVSGN